MSSEYGARFEAMPPCQKYQAGRRLPFYFTL